MESRIMNATNTVGLNEERRLFNAQVLSNLFKCEDTHMLSWCGLAYELDLLTIGSIYSPFSDMVRTQLL